MKAAFSIAAFIFFLYSNLEKDLISSSFISSSMNLKSFSNSSYHSPLVVCDFCFSYILFTVHCLLVLTNGVDTSFCSYLANDVTSMFWFLNIEILGAL